MNNNNVAMCLTQRDLAHTDVTKTLMYSKIIHRQHLGKSKKDLLSDVCSNLLLSETSGVEC